MLRHHCTIKDFVRLCDGSSPLPLTLLYSGDLPCEKLPTAQLSSSPVRVSNTESENTEAYEDRIDKQNSFGM
jgi:hypothetical protein